MTVADYCKELDRNEITINRKYQRSDRVWPTAARSYLIETILLGLPIPKLSLHQRTDIRTRRTFKEVVDGQQRTKAISDFAKDGFRLSRRLELEEARGRTYSRLDDDLQQRFLDYGLNFDLFTGATEADVREVFRRMNSYTVPLNAEEQRHARFQGPFKWFIREVAADYDELFIGARVFTENQLVRMADTKLLTEISHAFFDGITTTNKRKLDDLYRSRDEEFPEETELGNRIRKGFDQLADWDDLYGTALMKPYAVYALVLAIMHLQEAIPALDGVVDDADVQMQAEDEVVVNLSRLAEALEADDEEGPMREFVRASSERTNVESQREMRFRWFFRALTESLPE
jgi:uncharacterized protein DUF262